MITADDDKQNLENNRSEPLAQLPEQPDEVKPIKAESNKMALFRGMAIPQGLSLGAILLAAFLVFPAYKGFVSGREIQRLKEEAGSAHQALSLSRTQVSKLENDLYRVGVLRQGRVGDPPARGLGLYLSPILSLEQKKSELPDLIHIDFRNNEESVLAFDPSRLNVEELQMRILREGNLVWLQTISIPPKTLLVQDLVTFVLTRDTLDAGEYQIKVEGNPSREIKRLAEFDLTIER
jgi:hypothetical protein